MKAYIHTPMYIFIVHKTNVFYNAIKCFSAKDIFMKYLFVGRWMGIIYDLLAKPRLVRN